MVAHNASFDRRFWATELQRLGSLVNLHSEGSLARGAGLALLYLGAESRAKGRLFYGRFGGPKIFLKVVCLATRHVAVRSPFASSAA